MIIHVDDIFMWDIIITNIILQICEHIMHIHILPYCAMELLNLVKILAPAVESIEHNASIYLFGRILVSSLI